LYLFHRPEMMTLQLEFQLREEVEIARSYIWAVGRMWEVQECFSSPEILELKAQCELTRYRAAAPSRRMTTYGPVT